MSNTPVTSTIDVLELIPEEQVWLDALKTANTRRAYQNDVMHFATVLGISPGTVASRLSRVHGKLAKKLRHLL